MEVGQIVWPNDRWGIIQGRWSAGSTRFVPWGRCSARLFLAALVAGGAFAELEACLQSQPCGGSSCRAGVPCARGRCSSALFALESRAVLVLICLCLLLHSFPLRETQLWCLCLWVLVHFGFGVFWISRMDMCLLVNWKKPCKERPAF